MKKLLLALFCLSLSTSVVWAASVPPNPASNPILSNIQKMGAKFFYLGNRAGIDGWFIVKDGQVQIAYATPDNKNILVGALFGQDGENITAAQISSLIQTNPEAATLIKGATKEQTAIAQAGSPPAPASVPAPNAVPSMPLSPGERLIHDLGAAATVIIGKPDSPEIIMVMDPRCPHCQATWKALRDSVAAGGAHLRMVPIGAPGSDNERAAAMLLTQADPMTAWDKYVGGDASALAGTPDPAALAAIKANHSVIDNWKIQSTPYLVYRAKNGKVKVVQGEPDKVSAVLVDLGP